MRFGGVRPGSPLTPPPPAPFCPAGAHDPEGQPRPPTATRSAGVTTRKAPGTRLRPLWPWVGLTTQKAGAGISSSPAPGDSVATIFAPRSPGSRTRLASGPVGARLRPLRVQVGLTTQKTGPGLRRCSARREAHDLASGPHQPLPLAPAWPPASPQTPTQPRSSRPRRPLFFNFLR